MKNKLKLFLLTILHTGIRGRVRKIMLKLLITVDYIQCFTRVKADLPLLGSKYISFGDFKSLNDRIDNDCSEEIVANIPVVFPYPNSDYYFVSILCHYFFPVCLYRDTQIFRQCKKFYRKPLL